MLRNYFITILRQIRKNRLYSLINILGLAMGIAACITIAQYVQYHVQFDTSWKNSQHIFRVQTLATKSGLSEGESARCSPLMGQMIADENPLVTSMARLYNLDYLNNTFSLNKDGQSISFQERGAYSADKSFFDLFGIEFVAGGPDKFDQNRTLILTESIARKYSQDLKSLIGNSMTVGSNNGERTFEIVGIIKDLPSQSHFEFNSLISTQSIENEYGIKLSNWGNFAFYTYLELAPHADISAIEKDIYRIHKENARKQLDQYGYVIDYSLMGLEKLHLYSTASTDFKPSVDYRMIFALSTIAIIILVVAWINYLNLSLVKILDRLKEVGIRKVMGSKTKQITLLFLLEAVILNSFAFLLAITIVQLSSPFIEQLTGIEFGILQSTDILLAAFVVVILGSFLIGSYPAIILKSFDTANILTGNKKTQKLSGFSLRSILVSFQFIITFLLIGVTITIYKQISYMKASDLGLDISDILVIKSPPGDLSQQDRPDVKKFNSFKTALDGRSEIISITNAGEIPGEPITWGGEVKLPGKSTEESIGTSFMTVGKGFMDFFGISIVAGRKLGPQDSAWGNGAVVVNEKLAELLGFDNPEDALGKKLEGFYSRNPTMIVGVAKNHHQVSLHSDFDPIMYIQSSWTEFYFVKMNLTQEEPAERAQALSQTMNLIQREWSNSFTNTQMDYFFLDDNFNQQYAADEQFGKIFGTFSILAILIASLGLYGLTTFTLQQRIKEIGIRKVLGAKSLSLTLLLSKNYASIISVAYLIAMPVCWITLSNWLENYHFSISLGWWLLVIPLVFVCSVAALTIVSRIIKSISLNPVESLKYE